jgi:hypothetical protein
LHNSPGWQRLGLWRGASREVARLAAEVGAAAERAGLAIFRDRGVELRVELRDSNP